MTSQKSERTDDTKWPHNSPNLQRPSGRTKTLQRLKRTMPPKITESKSSERQTCAEKPSKFVLVLFKKNLDKFEKLQRTITPILHTNIRKEYIHYVNNNTYLAEKHIYDINQEDIMHTVYDQ